MRALWPHEMEAGNSERERGPWGIVFPSALRSGLRWLPGWAMILWTPSSRPQSHSELTEQTNLPGYRTTLYKNMQRSYLEFQRFAEQVQLTSPQSQSQGLAEALDHLLILQRLSLPFRFQRHRQ